MKTRLNFPPALSRHFILLMLCFASAVQADDMSVDLASARSLLASGQAAQAQALLEPNLLQWAGNPEYDYLLGEVWYQLGKTGEALFAFERVLIGDPSNIEVRLKAARISIERGNAAAAQALLAPLATAKLNAAQQQTADQLRTALSETARPTAIQGYLSAGVGWSDNVTGGPNLTDVMIPALGRRPTALGTSTKGGDMLGTVEAGLSVRKSWDDSTWLTGDGSLHQGFNRSRKDVAEGLANLNLGILKRTGTDFFGAAVLLQNYMVSNATYRQSQGFRLNWLHPVNDHANLTTYFQQLNFSYPTRVIDNATRNVLGASYQTNAAKHKLLYGMYVGRETAKDPTKPHFSFDIWGWNLGGQIIVNPDLSLAAGLVYEQHRYGVTDALFGVFRIDTQQAMGVTADYRIHPHWHLQPSYSYTHNVSNIALYDYIRNAFTLQLKWDFDNENK